MRIANLICIPCCERTLHRRTSNSEGEQTFGQRCMDCIDVLGLILTGSKARGYSARNDGTTDIEVGLALLVRRFVAGERISCVKRFVFNQQLSISMKRARASAVDDLGCRLPLPVLAKPIGTIFRRESVVVDPNILGLSLLALAGGRAIILRARPLLPPGGFVIYVPCRELFRPQIILKPLEKFLPHPFNCRAQTIRLLPLRWTRSKVHQVPEQVFRSLPPVLHHENDGPFLFFGERKARIREDAFDFILQLGERICSSRYQALWPGRRLLGNQRTGECEDEQDQGFHWSASNQGFADSTRTSVPDRHVIRRTSDTLQLACSDVMFFRSMVQDYEIALPIEL